MSRLQLLAMRWMTPANVRAARALFVLAAGALALAHPGVHIPHVLADDDAGGP